MILYHFTSTKHVPMIQSAQALMLTDSMLDASDRFAGPPVLWLLDQPELGGFSHGIAYDHWPVDKSEIRFTVDVPDGWIRRWVDWARAQRIEHRWLEQTVKLGGGWDAADHWMISFSKVTADRWLEVRNMHTGEVLDLADVPAV